LVASYEEDEDGGAGGTGEDEEAFLGSLLEPATFYIRNPSPVRYPYHIMGLKFGYLLLEIVL
jgi:hypothetical protein